MPVLPDDESTEKPILESINSWNGLACPDPDDPSYPLLEGERNEGLGPFERCRGDCNENDGNCAEGLVCFKRSMNGPDVVPGCRGAVFEDIDYHCVDQSDVVSHLHQVRPGEDEKFQRCQGSCDVDGDCAGELKCSQSRDETGLETVPGCCGTGRMGTDYCYDPADAGDEALIEDDSSPTEGLPSDDVLPAEPTCTTDLMIQRGEEGKGKYQKCQGSCDVDDDCEGDLQCFQRRGATKCDPVPGCCGTGSPRADYCYDPNDPVASSSTPAIEADSSPCDDVLISGSEGPPPSREPTPPPTPGANLAFLFGKEFVTHDELGIQVSRGLSVRLIATAGERVRYADGDKSKLKYHSRTDAAGIIPLYKDNPTEGGYVYVSNAERGGGLGGVFGIYFDKDGNVLDYKQLLTDSTKNCGGGLTPWHTWVSCEEFRNGGCWQVDPDPESEHHDTPQQTKLGGLGGRYESVAVDNRIPEKPVFFVTEDHAMGALRRFVANGTGWESLQNDGETTFLHILDNSTYEWTSDESLGRASANEHFQNSEGISYHEGQLYFMAKKERKLIVLDLENMTYETERTGMKFYGEGSFGNEPDQILHGPRRKYIYFCEDGGPNPGVYARHSNDGTYFTVFEAFDERYKGDETVGIAISPGGKRLIAGIQDAGVIFEFTRDDGLPFE